MPRALPASVSRKLRSPSSGVTGILTKAETHSDLAALTFLSISTSSSWNFTAITFKLHRREPGRLKQAPHFSAENADLPQGRPWDEYQHIGEALLLAHQELTAILVGSLSESSRRLEASEGLDELVTQASFQTVRKQHGCDKALTGRRLRVEGGEPMELQYPYRHSWNRTCALRC